MDEARKLAIARRRVAALEGFYAHLAAYVLVTAILIVLNLFLTPKVWWAQWVLLGWGLGVLGHAAAVFGRTPERIRRWEERKIAEIKNRL